MPIDYEEGMFKIFQAVRKECLWVRRIRDCKIKNVVCHFAPTVTMSMNPRGGLSLEKDYLCSRNTLLL